MLKLPTPHYQKFQTSTLLKGVSQISFANQNQYHKFLEHYQAPLSSNIKKKNINSSFKFGNNSNGNNKESFFKSKNLNQEQYKQDQQKLKQKSFNNSYFALLANNSNKNQQTHKNKHSNRKATHQEHFSDVSIMSNSVLNHQSNNSKTESSIIVHSIQLYIQRAEQKQSNFIFNLSKFHNKIFCCQPQINSKKRYQGFIVNQNIYFNKILSQKVETQYSINLNTVQCEIKHYYIPNPNQQNKKKNTYSVLIIGHQIRLFLSCFSQQENQYNKFNRWIDILEKAIKSSYGKKYQLRQINQRQNFQKKKYKLQREFVQQCQTGDILLFQGKSLSAKAQRFFTGSDFDHIAMVIKDPVYNILMYEAMGLNGVNLTPWNLMIENDWYKYVKKISWRKLVNIQRTPQFDKLIDDFVRKNIRAQYHISIQKLIANQSIQQQGDLKRGYFCSQLIAKMYKAIGLLPSQTLKDNKQYKPAHKYYPSHFCQKSDMKLLKGQLSCQYEIVFCQDMLQQDYFMH